MTSQTLLKSRKEIIAKIKFYKETLKTNFWEPMVKQFISEKVKFKVSDVIEIKHKDAKQKRWMLIDRFELYVDPFNSKIFIRAVGWGLDRFNKPKRWVGMGYIVYGACADFTLTLSDNQKINKNDIRRAEAEVRRNRNGRK